MSADPLAMLLRSFKLPTMAARYAETLASAEEQNWGYRRFLQQLCEAEAADRQERKRERQDIGNIGREQIAGEDPSPVADAAGRGLYRTG